METSSSRFEGPISADDEATGDEATGGGVGFAIKACCKKLDGSSTKRDKTMFFSSLKIASLGSK